MILGVAKVNEMLPVTLKVAHPLRVMEGSFFERAIYEPGLGIADHIKALSAVCINCYESVVPCVRDNQKT
jgi:hypothetical protein